MTLNTRHEAVSLHNYLTQRFTHSIESTLNENTLEISFAGGMTEQLKDALTDALADYMIEFYEEQWLIHILKHTFYFTDEGDQEDILNIVRAIFDGEKQELPKVDTLPSRYQMMREAIRGLFLEHSSFSFQSLETFRLNDYFECLTETVELAIDEFKLQQEYGAFVDKLRRIVKAYRPLHHTIYAVDKDSYVLYDEHYRIIDDPGAVRSFYPLLKQWGIEAEPSLLLTLIGLAPVNIYIFTDRIEDSMMYTLQKVFEERVHFFPIKEAEKLGLLFTG
ncbi:sporulation protein YtxC [Pullulanibacillus pueri]|nr:sporulation protein YtxC [Pullulanibacillus pueri]